MILNTTSKAVGFRQDKTRQLYYFFDIFVYDTVMPDLAPHVAERQEQ